MANEHPKFEGERSMRKIVEWVTDVRLCEAENKDVTKPRLGPRLCTRLGQPMQIIKTLGRETSQTSL